MVGLVPAVRKFATRWVRRKKKRDSSPSSVRVQAGRWPGLAPRPATGDHAGPGGPASARMDPLGKGMGQMLLDLPIAVPKALARQLG